MKIPRKSYLSARIPALDVLLVANLLDDLILTKALGYHTAGGAHAVTLGEGSVAAGPEGSLQAELGRRRR